MRHQLVFLLLLLGCHGVTPAQAAVSNKNAVDVVVFSYDRPIQLLAFLESLYGLTQGIGNVFVLSKASSKPFAEGYRRVFDRFPQVINVPQASNPPTPDFKPLFVDILQNQSMQDYVVLATDDIIVCDKVDLRVCASQLDRTKALGFYLRLGKNITANYMQHKTAIRRPTLKALEQGNLWQWRLNEGDTPWSYPHSVDMTVFQRAYVLAAAQNLDYKAPNSFELVWSRIRPKNATGLCFTRSKIVNIPANIVQTEYVSNRHEKELSPEQLLAILNANKKIDIAPFYRINNRSAHMPYSYRFIPLK